MPMRHSPFSRNPLGAATSCAELVWYLTRYHWPGSISDRAGVESTAQASAA